MSNELIELAKNAARWADPEVFGREVCGIKEFYGKQKQVFADWVDPSIPRVGLIGAGGTGKTLTEAVLILHFLATNGGSDPQDHPKGVATAIDGKNMEMNLWPEIAKLIYGSRILNALLKIQSEKIFMLHAPMTWFFEKRTWDAKSTSDPNSPTGALGLAGHHSKNSLFVIEESSGVPMSVLNAAERTLANRTEGPDAGFCKILQAGNPTSKTGPLYAASIPPMSKMWNGGRGPVRMTADPDDPDRCPFVNKQWAQDQIDALGRENPFVQVYILAEFPDQDFNSFLGIEELKEAMTRDYPWNIYSGTAPKSMMDVAYDGGDKSWIWTRQGVKAFIPEELRVPLSDPQIGMNMSALVQTHMALHTCKDLFVDATGGYASAVMEAMRVRGINPTGIKFNEKKGVPEEFENVRSWMYWKAAQWVKNGGSLPYDESLIEEAIATRYIINKKGKMQCEDKTLVKNRLGRSPDRWDAFVGTFYMDDRPMEDVQARTGEMQDAMTIDSLAIYRPQRRPSGGDRDWHTPTIRR